MDAAIPDNDIWVRDIDDEMMRQLETRARLNGRTVEEEFLALVKIGLSLKDGDG